MLRSTLAVTLLLGVACPASAIPVTVAFEAQISAITDDFGDFPGVQVGDTVTGTYTYDDSVTPSTFGSSSTSAIYGANIDFTVSILSLLFSSIGSHDVSRLDRYDGPYDVLASATDVDEDQYRVQSTESSAGTNITNQLFLDLVQAAAGDLVDGTSATGPLPDPSLANDANTFLFRTRFTQTSSGFGFVITDSVVEGTLTSLTYVPEPGATVLLGVTALVALHGRGGRKRR